MLLEIILVLACNPIYTIKQERTDSFNEKGTGQSSTTFLLKPASRCRKWQAIVSGSDRFSGHPGMIKKLERSTSTRHKCLGCFNRYEHKIRKSDTCRYCPGEKGCAEHTFTCARREDSSKDVPAGTSSINLSYLQYPQEKGGSLLIKMKKQLQYSKVTCLAEVTSSSPVVLTW
ncbi:hypothetical protein J6590_058366 [Homalodisca vitripennis]|nr:hypothetical protein J6590_058366 [Homalodisca vitripennis]